MACPTGTYPSAVDSPTASNICLACSPHCLDCLSSHHCLQCTSSTYLFDGVCLEGECPEGYYGDSSSQVCQGCSSSCLTCTGPSTYNCESCREGLLLYQGRCTQICRNGFYSEPAARLCRPCAPACLTCSNYGQCTTCSDGTTDCLNPQECTLDNCDECTLDNCEICASSSQCGKCFLGFYLQEGECRQICEDATYEDPTTGTC